MFTADATDPSHPSDSTATDSRHTLILLTKHDKHEHSYQIKTRSRAFVCYLTLLCGVVFNFPIGAHATVSTNPHTLPLLLPLKQKSALWTALLTSLARRLTTYAEESLYICTCVLHSHYPPKKPFM